MKNTDPRIAFVCRGGPENGPFSAMAARVISEKLKKNGLEVQAIYASSGSVPTALLGCVDEFEKLCGIWANLTPEKIVGKVTRTKTIFRIISKESILTSNTLKNLIKENWDLDKIFSSEARLAKFPAVDLLTTEYIIFSNKIPGHKEWFAEGVLGSMGLIPFLQPQMVYNPEEAGLIDKGKSKKDALVLIDGGFKGNMLLEEAMRDGFNVIFLIDIHGLKTTETDLNMKYHWTNLIRSGQHILSNANDVRQFQVADRINEEIRIKEELKSIAYTLPPEQACRLEKVIERMNNGRLRLGDKDEIEIYNVFNEEHSTLFNFAKFEQETVLQLLDAGYEAGENVLTEIGLN